MIEKEFSQLAFGERLKLQRLIKRHRSLQHLTDQERLLVDRFQADFEQAEQQAKARWPIVMLVMFAACLQLFAHQCR